MTEVQSEIPTRLIDPNPYQPRTHFPRTEQRELMESIRKNGLIQPIVLRRAGERYQILAGERRFRAYCELGFSTIPAHVREYDDEEMRTLSLLENLQREDLSTIEIARTLKLLCEQDNMTQEAVAEKISKNRSTVANYLRLLELPDEIQEDVIQKNISGGHARALLGLKDSHQIYSLRNLIVKKNLSVRETERRVQKYLGKAQTRSGQKQALPAAQAKNSGIRELEDKLSINLGTRVEIWGEKEGSIQIEFANPKEFNRIFNLIMERDAAD
ncbi:MAG: ParB/RepB/Spo0J family partition protein [Planctomycetes bacterium]|nr:ParB/RepB/Spo0J family partition protein [Planctomycetota bacterium]